MLRIIKFFQGYLYVYVSGYSPERFFNLCAKMNILMWNVRKAEDGYTFYMSKQAYAMIGPALKKTGTQIEVVRESGVPFLRHKYRKHIFFIIGIGCAAFLLIMMSQYIWKVDIAGNIYYSDQIINDFLEQNHAGYASLKKRIDCKELQDEIRAEFDDITWVSAKIEGTHLYIEIKERLRILDVTDSNQENAPSDLIATEDGIVESITTRQGTPLVMAGDEVSRGDILVSGTVELMDDYGSVAEKRYVKSDADVILRTVIPYEDEFSRYYEKKEKIGKKRTVYVINLKNYFFDLGKMKNKNNIVQSDETIPVVIGNDFYLPFQIVRKKWCEVTISSEEHSKYDIQHVAEEHYQKYNEKLRENGVQIIEKSVMIDDSGDIVHVTGELEVLITQKKFKDFTPQMQEGNILDGIDTTDD